MRQAKKSPRMAATEDQTCRELFGDKVRPTCRCHRHSAEAALSSDFTVLDRCMKRFIPAPRARAVVAATVLVLTALGTTRSVLARVKLITLPVRERVEIQLDNPSVTLVEEERIVPLVQGENQVDFSWANLPIDPNTIVFRVIGPVGNAAIKVNVVSVSYPPNEAALVWTVGASDSGSARVRISYLLGSLRKSFNYKAVASHDETKLTLAQYMRLRNAANEEFPETGVWAGFGPKFQKAIGLNETKELLIEKFNDVPIQKTYSCNPSEHGYIDRAQNKLRVPMHYVLKNDRTNQLGEAPMPYGKVRIFIEGAGDKGGTASAFLGEDWGKFTPKDDEMRLYLGVAQDIVVKRTIEKNNSKRIAGNLYDHEIVVKYEIENFKKQAVTLAFAENLRHLRGEVRGDTGRDVDWQLDPATTFAGGPDPELSTAEKLVFYAKLPGADSNGKAAKIVHTLSLVLKNEW
jgi:hypothetical protein